DGEVTLNINNAIMNARSAIALTEGQLLQLVVAQTGKQVVLQLPQNAVQQALTQQILRESLPRQQPLNETVNLVRQTLKEANQLNLPQPVRQALQNFVNRIPDSTQLENPEGLQRAIKNSGLFLEKSISQALDGRGNIDGNDMKVLLSQLKNLLSTQRTTLAQLPPAATEIKTPQNLQTPQTTLQQTVQQTQIQTQDVAKDITSKTILQQTAATPKTTTTSNAPQAPTTSASERNAAAASTQQVDTALKISAEQKATRPLTQTTQPATGTNAAPTVKIPRPIGPGVPENYNTGRQAASIKEALALNPTTHVGHAETAAVSSRFNNLIDLLDQLIKHVESSIARTHLHQLNTLQDQDAGRMAWSLEIPVRQEDETHLVKLDIEQESKKGDAEAMVTVNLAVNLEKLGAVYSKLTLKGKQVGVVFWAEQEHTFNLASNSLHELESNLVKSGFTTTKLNLHHGQPPQMEVPEQYLPDKLLDIKV
ncbi:MAG: flagellar hook-length control protein FliK, partial [Gammaproteobacteria bacterium]|nr:flagellar hook-length control protein FliK [Gammaproteobacteria bacterium]